MNTSNNKLIKRVRVFFKTVYVLVIIFLIVFLLSSTIMLISKTGFMAYPAIFGIDNPAVTFQINGKEIIPLSLQGYGIIEIKGAPLWLFLINALITITALTMYVLIIRNIRSIIRSIENSEVFSLKNAYLLRNIGLFILIDLIVSMTGMIFFSSYIKSYNSENLAGLIGVLVGESAGYIIAIVFTFFIAAIFKIGVSMQEENQSFV